MSKYKSAFDIIGPIMVGPSSSHTAGAVRIGLFARKFFGTEPKEAIITFYNSFATTYKGHGTDVAIIAGLLNFETDDTRLPDAIKIAEGRGMKITFIPSEEDADHPNTARIWLSDGEKSAEIVGISIGGGVMEITELNGFQLHLNDAKPSLFMALDDVKGVIATVTTTLANKDYNIHKLDASRKEGETYMVAVIELDEEITELAVETLKNLPITRQVAIIGN